MSTPESGSSNLLDAFFPATETAEEVEVDEVDGEGDEEAVIVAKARRSVPPPAPSKRGKRSAAPPPRGRSPSQPGLPPAPPSLRATWAGVGPELERESVPPVIPTESANEESGAGAFAESPEAGRLEPATTPGGFGTDGNLDEGALFAEAESLFDARLAATPAAPAVAEEPTADTDMATALAASLSLRGDTTSDPTSAASGNEDAAAADASSSPFASAPRGDLNVFAMAPRGDANVFAMAPRGDANPFAEAPRDEMNPFAEAQHGDADPFADAPRGDADAFAPAATDEAKQAFAELPRPPAPLAPPALGKSSAWPTPAKIDEWDDEWAPSLSALGAKEPDHAPEPLAVAEAPRPPAEPGRPFRLSLPPPPPPPRRSSAAATAPSASPALIDEPEVAIEETEAVSSPAAAPEVRADTAEGAHREPLQSMEVTPFEGSDDLSREDLTRPLPPTELARLAAEEGLPDRSEADLVRDDVTIPLPGLDSEGAASTRALLPDPYTSDTDLTRPLIALGESGESPRGLILPPLRPPPGGPSSSKDVPLIVAVPPPAVGALEDAPSIQITPGASESEYTPTSQLQRPWVPGATSPGMRGVLPPIPKPAPIPSDFTKRGPSQSVAPVTGSVFPPAGPARRKLAMMAAAALVFTTLVIVVGFKTRSGTLVVTVAGPGGESVSGVSVRVDGTERCNTAPCYVKDLKSGMHLVSASANGLQASADRAVVLESGGQVAQHIALSSEERSTAGLSVAAIGTGLHVVVDGRDVGAPPVTLNDVAPGEHTVRILGADRYYQPYEETVRLDRGEVRSLGPVRLRVLRGKLDLRAGEGSEGAAVSVDGRRIWHLPASIELSAEESHEVSAVRPGYPEINQEIVFDGTAERSVNIAFPGSGGGDYQAYHPSNGASHAGPSSISTTTRTTTRGLAAAAPAVAAPSTGGATATLDLNSTPPAAVVVNGRPLGTTPIHGVHVGAGKQTVVFVHPSLGRKVASATVAPGGRAAIGVKF